MARAKRHRTRKKFLYFFLNDQAHKVLKASRSKDELIAWCYPEKKRVLYSYSLATKNMQTAYTIAQAAAMVNKHKITIEDYILEGKIKTPTRIYPISNPESTWSKYLFNEKDIFDLHEFISDSGHSNNLPSKAELTAILKHNLILYTKTEEGNFVPVWKAE